MELPNAAHARVDRRKITEYLLCPSHPDGRSKAEFFRHFGFRIEEWAVLADALRKHGKAHPVRSIVDSAFGTRYTIDGDLETPDGRRPRVRTVWLVTSPSLVPRLITAHPA